MPEDNVQEIIMHLVVQLGVILIAAKLAGEVAERFLKVPPVLGELVAGIIIGPYALGGISYFGLDPLFPKPEAAGGIPVSNELYSIAQIASVVLLFLVGLETDLRQFMRYAGPAFLVGLGGVVLPFLFGMYATVLFGFAESLADPRALFMGAIMTATSVGITARVLSDLGRLASPEGVTILAAAVIDDVLGILVLTIVVGISEAGSVSAGEVGLVALKAFGFWLGLTGVAFLASGYIARLVGRLRVSGAAVAIGLALALLAAGLAESFGLALIIGAYSIGLALSHTEFGRRLGERMHGLYEALVPVFFVVMGMLVDVSAMRAAILFGVVISLLAIVGKVVGCGVPAFGLGFNLRGASRVGIGMLPRGEVALIIAGIGLARGVVDSELFGVAILMTIVTTLLAPLFLVQLFSRGGSGRRAAAEGA